MNIFSLPIRDLVLNNVGINENIYPNFSKSTTLQVIDLSNNAIKGSPISYKNVNLKILKLSSNQLTGTLEVLRNFEKLEEIELQNNLFSGVVPILTNLTETLRVLDIRNNQLNDPFPVIDFNF